MRRVWAICTAIQIAVGMCAAPAFAAGSGVFTVYVSTSGSDSNDGRTPGSALATLDGVQHVLAAAQPQADVEVRIARGTYVARSAPARWRFYVPGHSISFMPATYRAGRSTPLAQQPVFHGPDTPAWWFQANLPDGNAGGDTNLRFLDLVVEHYTAGGMTIAGPTTTNDDGITVPASAGLNHNVVSGITFRYGGSTNVPAHYGWGALDFVNSSDDVITGNHFVDLENGDADADLIHGVYLAHHSDHNVIRGNEFRDVSGDPMRVRNDSDGNDIGHNTFVRTGKQAFYSDWFCDVTCVNQNPGHGRECASHANTFHDNVLVSGYGGAEIATVAFFVGDVDYPGETGCDNHGQPRVRAWNNRS